MTKTHRKQRTISGPVSCTGVGLHTGVESTITFRPAPDNYGIQFSRTDIKGSPEIRADIDHVVDISRGTTIAQNGVRIHTVEHALAAVSGLRLDNVLIELTAKEAPVMDGSAKDFVDALESVNFIEQKKDRHVLDISKPVVYSDLKKEIDIHVVPADRFRVTFLVEYPLPALGTQYEAIYNMEEDFARDVAPARTFCFLSEVEQLREKGLIKGGSLSNAVVILDRRIENGEINHLRNLFGIKDKVIQGTNEEVGDIHVEHSDLNGIDVKSLYSPRMIDEYPILAVAAATASGKTILRGLKELKVKESNRFAAIVNGLRSCKVLVEDDGENIIITGTKNNVEGGATINSNFDHRIAMSFLILGAVSNKPIKVMGCDSISTSYPNFLTQMNELGMDIRNDG